MRKSYKTLTFLATIALFLTSCNQPKEEPKYTVTWKNYDGTVLEVDTELDAGIIPTFDSPTPAKAQDAQYNYIFDGWTPAVAEVSADTEYVAKFKEETRKYTVTWKNYDGTVLKEEEVLYGTTPDYDGETPTRGTTVEHTYTFEGWSPTVVALTENTTYTASFKEEARKYNITWKNEDGSVLRTDSVAYGEIPSYGETAPTKENTPQYAYTFANWTPAITPVTGNVTYQAAYTSEVRKYTVTWVNEDGTVLKVDEGLSYGDLPAYTGETPKKDSDRAIKYTFKGWEPSIQYVGKDQTYTAKYEAEGFFSFEPIQYEMQPGYHLSDIVGSPWINSNVRGEMNKIKKPSLKDDFYASVNYEKIKENADGPFDDCKNRVNAALETMYNGGADYTTTNGMAISALIDKVVDGDASSISTYLKTLDARSYLSSKKAFMGKSAYYTISKTDDGYMVGFNDGYMNSNYECASLFLSFSQYSDTMSKIVKGLSDKLGLGLTSSDMTSIKNFDSDMVNKAYNAYYQSGISLSYSTVGNLTWAPLKNALTDLGLAANTKISYYTFYENVFNSIFNDYFVNNLKTVGKDIEARLAFDSRFVVGLSNYKSISGYMADLADYFPKEAYLSYSDDDAYIARVLATQAVAIATEQTYDQLDSSPEIKAEVSALIDDVLGAYKEVAQNSWLTKTTKNKMLKKLEYMKYGSCYSDATMNFPQFVDSNTPLKSGYTIYNDYLNALLTQTINGENDTTGYFSGTMSSWTVNAYYSPSTNSFVILNGLAKGTLGNSIEEKYGMLGAVIGHEITHGFDSSGSLFDENGNYNDWWTSSDRRNFNTKVNNMISFYEKIHLKKNLVVDGDNTNGECTADMGGVKIMLTLAKKIPDFDYDKFFRAFTNLWLERPISYNDIDTRAQDEHPFEYLRTNVTLAQFDEFVETYDIKPGDGMYIPEDQRVKIW